MKARLAHDAMMRTQRFEATEKPYGVEVRNDDARRAAEYEVAYYVGGKTTGVVERRLRAGERTIEPLPIDGGEITNIGRVDVDVAWPVESPDEHA
jgi:hypothetical protein